MKRLIYSNFKNQYTDLGLLLIRIIIGLEMGFYGLDKMMHFSENSIDKFWNEEVNFLGMGGTITISLVIFSELFCSFFILIGFLTRLSLIPLIITVLYILFLDNFKIISVEEGSLGINAGFKFLIFYVILMLSGPGKYSLDHRFFKI